MKVGNRNVQIGFGEVIGNAFKQDEKKLNEDHEKLLKGKNRKFQFLIWKSLTNYFDLNFVWKSLMKLFWSIAMQLALFNLRKLFPQNSSGLEDLETFGLLVYSM